MDLDAGDSPWGGKLQAALGGSHLPHIQHWLTLRNCRCPFAVHYEPWRIRPGYRRNKYVRLIHLFSLYSETVVSPAQPCHASRTLIYFTDTEQPTQQTDISSSRSPVRRGPRGTRRVNAQATKLEAVGGEVDPLGPLGDKAAESSPLSSEEAPEPPQKETAVTRNARPATSTSQASSLAGMMDSVNLEEDGAGFRGPPPVQPPVDAEGVKRQTQPSVSIEEASKPTFEIVVGDPHKVGDLTSSHIVYQVRTRVREQPKR